MSGKVAVPLFQGALSWMDIGNHRLVHVRGDCGGVAGANLGRALSCRSRPWSECGDQEAPGLDHSGKLDSSTISCSTGLGPDSSKSPVFVKRNRDPQRTTGARRPEPCRVRRTRNSSEGQDKQARSLRPESAACQVFICAKKCFEYR